MVQLAKLFNRVLSHQFHTSQFNKYEPSSITTPSSMPKFAANLSFLFTNKPFEQRYQLAKAAGFQAVESGFPFGLTRQQIVDIKNSANVEQVLMNAFTGDVTKGELGFAAIPGKEKAFIESIKLSIDYASALRCKKIHIMAGIVETVTRANDEVYELNLRRAVCILEQEGIMGLIEPINKYAVPNYYMNSYEKAISLIKDIDSPNLKLMLDIFHLQQIQGNIYHTINEFSRYIGHVQIAQVPNRHEPNFSGELNYKYIFEALEQAGYKDWIGLEYKPAATTEEGLKWIQDFGYTL